jgi:protocatechuate 3,4-dioxygenase beta subunit
VISPGAADCILTEPNPAGPFYLPGAPFGDRIAHPDEPSRPLEIRGRVQGVSPAGCTPLPAAVLDVWHASAGGVYYGLEREGVPEPFALRGRIRADAWGRYALHSILPGHYPLSRTRSRPRHIHSQVSAPGHRTLITQLYFRGDPLLAGDSLVRPALVIELKDEGGILRGVFEIALAREG